MELNFCEYLINIGFINKKSFSNLILEYQKAYSNNNNFLANMIFILKNFIDNLSQEEKNYMSLNLVQNYLQIIKNKKLLYQLKTIYILYKGKLSLIKLKYLSKWKLISLLNKSNDENEEFFSSVNIKQNKKIKKRKYRNELNELDKYKFNFFSMKINNNKKDNGDKEDKEKFQIIFNNYNKRKHPISSQNESSTKKYDSTKDNSIKKNKKYLSELQTSLALREKKELRECTFSPKINNNTSRTKNAEEKELSTIKNNDKKLRLEIFNKLHNDNIIYKNKIKTSREKYEKEFNEQNTFRPRIYSNSFTKKYSKNNKSFGERQKNFLEKKEKNSEKIKKTMDEKFSKLCPFVPEVNIKFNKINIKEETKGDNSNNPKSQSTKYISPFLRLYEDSKHRNLRQIKRETEYDNYINDLANIFSKKDGEIDYNKINELYIYQKKNEIMKKTKKKVEDEEGSTFKPYIYFNELSKNINSDFYQRNEKFLEDKQNFIKLSIKEKDKLYKNYNKYSKEEKKEIVKNIIKRLTENNTTNCHK